MGEKEDNYDILSKRNLPKVTSTDYDIEEERQNLQATEEDKEFMTDVYVKPFKDPNMADIDIEPNLPVIFIR